MIVTDKLNDPAGLFAYLDARGIRQTWLADKLGISPQYLTEIKAGRKPMPATMPALAAEALGVDIVDLFPDANETQAA